MRNIFVFMLLSFFMILNNGDIYGDEWETVLDSDTFEWESEKPSETKPESNARRHDDMERSDHGQPDPPGLTHHFFIPPKPSEQTRAQLESEWKATDLKNHPALIEVLVTFQRNPNSNNGIRVLEKYTRFADLPKGLRADLFTKHTRLFQSLCALKLDVTDAGRMNIPDVDHSIRFGSSAMWYMKWCDWFGKGRPMDDMPKLDSNKQFSSDDDLMNRATKAAHQKSPGADEGVNGEKAAYAFMEGVKNKYGITLDPQLIKTGFLSPTQAWPIMQKKQNANVKWPNYLPAWVLSDREKYNGDYAVEQISEWLRKNGIVTLNVQDSNSTIRYSAFTGQAVKQKNPLRGFSDPGRPLGPGDPGDISVWMANNHRQIFHLHGGDTQYLAKYLGRDMDGWKKYGLALPASDSGESPEQIRRLCNRIYAPATPEEAKNLTGMDGRGTRDKLIKYARKLLVNVHEQTVGNLVERFREIAPKSGTQTEMDRFVDGNDARILKIKNQLALTYANIDAELQTELIAQARKHVEAAFPEDKKTPIPGEARIKGLMGKRLLRSLEEIDVASTETRKNAEIFSRIKDGLGKRINAVLYKDWKHTVEDLLHRVANNDLSEVKIRWHNGMFVSGKEPRQLIAVEEDLRTLESVGDFLGWSKNQHAEFFMEYLNAGNTRNALNNLRLFHEVFEPSSMRTQFFEYEGSNGEKVRIVIEPTVMERGRSLGLLTFKAAMKGYSIWNDVKDAQTLYTKLNEIFSGTLTAQSRRKAHAEILKSVIGLSDYLKMAKYFSRFRYANEWYGLGGTLTTACSLAASDTLGDEEASLLLFALLKDASLMYAPQLGVVYTLWGIASWGWESYTLSAAKADVIDLLVENGMWDLSGTLPELKGVYFDKKNKRVKPVKAVAKLLSEEFKDGVEIINDNNKVIKKVFPRKSLLEIAYQQYLPNDPLLKVTKRAAGEYFHIFNRSLELENLTDARQWTKESVESGLKIKFPDGFDEDSKKVLKAKIISTGDVSGVHAGTGGSLVAIVDFPANARKVFAYLIGDYWIKRQNILEGPVLDAIVKEAARRKYKEERAEVDAAKYLDELLKILERVKKLDQDLWPMVADSAKPFRPVGLSGPDTPSPAPILQNRTDASPEPHPATTWDPGPEYPISLKYLKDTGIMRNRLLSLVTWLNNKSIPRPLKEKVEGINNPRVRQVEMTDKEILDEAKQVVEILVDTLYNFETHYSGIMRSFSSCDNFVRQGNQYSLKPWFHVGLNPLRISNYITDKENEDSKAVAEWLREYKVEVVTVENDIAQFLREIQGKVLRERILNSWGLIWVSGEENDIAHSHPYWQRLLMLRFQIRKLTILQKFHDTMTRDEFESTIKGRMLMEMKPVKLPEDLTYPNGAFRWIKEKAIPAMEKEYDRLIIGLQEAFKVKVTLARVPAGEPFYVWSLLKATADLELAEKDKQDAPSSNGASANATRVDPSRKDLEAQITRMVRKVVFELQRPDGSLYWKKEIPSKDVKVSTPWLCPLMEAGKFFAHVKVMGTDDLLLGQGRVSMSVEPAQLTGKFRIIGDWPVFSDASEIKILAEDVVIGTVAPPEGRDPSMPLNLAVNDLWKNRGSFKNLNLDDLENSFYVDFNACAQVGITKSTAIKVTATGPGVLEIAPDQALELVLFYKVDVEVTVKDAAGKKVPGKITFLQDGVSLDAVSPPDPLDYIKTGLAFQRDQVVGAHAKRESPEPAVEAKAPPVTFDYKNHYTIPLEVDLPFFEKEHLKVTGIFQPQAGIQPPVKLTGGLVSCSLADEVSVGAGEMLSFANSKPWPLEKPLTLKAVLWDDGDRVFKPGAQILKKLKPGPVYDLGVMEVGPHKVEAEPLRVVIEDWAGRKLLGDNIRVTIGEKSASRVGKYYTGSWTFTRRKEQVKIKVGFQIPDGQKIRAEHVFTISDRDFLSEQKIKPEPIHVKLPFYEKFTVQVKNRVKVPEEKKAPAKVMLTHAETGRRTFRLEMTVNADQVERVTMPQPVAVKTGDGRPNKVSIHAKASEDGITYEGSGSVEVPQKPARSSMDIELKHEGQGYYAVFQTTMPFVKKDRKPKKRDSETKEAWKKRKKAAYEQLVYSDFYFQEMPLEKSPFIIQVTGEALETYPEAEFVHDSKWAAKINCTILGNDGKVTFGGAILMTLKGIFADKVNIFSTYPALKAKKNLKIFELSNRSGEFTVINKKATTRIGPLRKGWSKTDKHEAVRFIKSVNSLYDCFIAHVVYDYTSADKVDLFRKFRNRVLKKTEAGSHLIRLYYEYGPDYAMRLRLCPELIPYMRSGLDGFAAYLEEIDLDDPDETAKLNPLIRRIDKIVSIFWKEGENQGLGQFTTVLVPELWPAKEDTPPN